jgi:hypothetical protein
MSAHDFAPRRVGELLDDAIALVTSNWRTVLPFAAVIVLPVAAAYSIVASFYIRSVFELGNLGSSTLGSGSPGLTGPDVTMLVTAGLMQVLALIFTVAKGAFDATLYATSSELLERRPVRLKAALKMGAKVIVPVVVLQFIVGLVSGMAGLLTLGIGGIALATLWSVAYPAVVLEGGIGQALTRSWGLVKRHFWRVLLITIAVGLLGAQFESALAAPTIVREVITGVTSTTGPFGQIAWGWKVFDGMAQGIAISLVLPFTTSVTLLNYLDLRARDEGMDLIIRSRGLLPS